MVSKTMTLAEVVQAAPGTAAVLEYHHLAADDRAVGQAAEQAGLCGCELVQALDAAARAGRGPWQMSLVELMEDIVATHHAFLRKALPNGTVLLDQAQRQARQPRALDGLIRVYETLREELEMHMAKEERILFPMIWQVARGKTITLGCGQVEGPISQMQYEHDSAKEALRQIQALRAGDALAQAGLDEATVAAIHRQLQQLHDDLALHIYKENQVLFPKTVQMQQESEGE